MYILYIYYIFILYIILYYLYHIIRNNFPKNHENFRLVPISGRGDPPPPDESVHSRYIPILAPKALPRS